MSKWLDFGIPEVIKITYKGKRYVIFMCKEEQRVKPEKKNDYGEDETDEGGEEIVVKDFERRFWNVTVNINGETVVLGWGFGKHLIFWVTLILLFFLIRRYLKKRRKSNKSICFF